MSHDATNRVTADRAAVVCERFAPGETAKGLLRTEMTVGKYLDVLIEAREFPDAIRFLAHALPKRKAVWWACHCVRKLTLEEPSATIATALSTAESWVIDPN